MMKTYYKQRTKRNPTSWKVICILLILAFVVRQQQINKSCYRLSDHVEKRYVKDEACYTRKTVLKAQINLMSIFIHQMNQHNIIYWLNAGSLLGTVRNGRVIPYDKDGDVGVTSEGLRTICGTDFDLPEDGRYVFEVYGCENKPRGTRDTRLPARLIDTSIGLYVDIVEHTNLDYMDDEPESKDENNLSVMPSVYFGGCKNCRKVHYPKGTSEYVSYFTVPRGWLFPLSKCVLEGFETFCPNKSEEILRYFYGDTFMKPDKPYLLSDY